MPNLTFYNQSDTEHEFRIIAYCRDIALVRIAFRRNGIPVRECALGRGYGNSFQASRVDIPAAWIGRSGEQEIVTIPVHEPKRRGPLHVPTQKPEGASSELARRERNDCTVCAIAGVTGLDYEAAYRIAEASGRKKNSGGYSFEIIKVLKKRGFHCDKLETWKRRVTLKTFIEEHTRGSYYVTIPHHAFALRDGQVISTKSYEQRYARIRSAWRITSA